jgi:LuxR family transcriptional regulator, maltose regulon positive regulatory protein
MYTDLLASKVSIPQLRSSLVPRPRLLQSLNDGLVNGRKLTLISAPAGFGKTTLVIDWLRQTDCPAAWLSLEEADNDLPRFLAYLALAIEQVDEELGAPLRNALQSSQLPGVEKILAGSLNEIAAKPDPLLLILDDYHVLTEKTILDGMRFLIDHQPHQLHLVLTTREDPDVPLARLRARNQLTELRARDLRFNRQETDAFLRDVMGLALSEQDITTLEGRTEGWAAGLQLAGLSMQKQGDHQAFIAEFSGSHRHILDYLTEEVLQRQPENIRSFLLQTSILDRITAPLCDAVTERSDSDQVLTSLEAANLFIIPLDEERRWYRYHHLFSDLLRSQLVRQQRESVPELHRRASRWYEGKGQIQDAIEHALQESDLTRAAKLIEQHAVSNLHHGRITTVLAWLDRLPNEILESAPILCINKAWALSLLQRTSRLGEVNQIMQTAVRALDHIQADEPLRRQVNGQIASLRAFLLPDDPSAGATAQMVIALSEDAQRLLPDAEKALHSVNAMNIGHGYLAMADLESAGLAFEQVLEDGLASGNYYAAIYGAIQLILIAILVGNHQEALRLCNSNIPRFNRIHAGQYFPSIGALHILKGSLLLEHNRTAEAEPLLQEGLELVRWTEETHAHREGYKALARLYAIQGNRSAITDTLKTMKEVAPAWTLYAEALHHRLCLCHWPGDLQTRSDARNWLTQSRIEFEQLPIIDALNPTMAATLETRVNTAYVLAHLAKEIPGSSAWEGAQDYLSRQMKFAETHRLANWTVPIAITQALFHQASARKENALESLKVALRAAAPTDLFRNFLDECNSLQPLLVELHPRLKEETLAQYTGRLLTAWSGEHPKPAMVERQDEALSERELEVLRYLVKGLSYEEIGRQLYLSLNTIQFHVKNIYGKLLVHKRVQAIEKARELGLI